MHPYKCAFRVERNRFKLYLKQCLIGLPNLLMCVPFLTVYSPFYDTIYGIVLEVRSRFFELSVDNRSRYKIGDHPGNNRHQDIKDNSLL
jgi:hypothetical protein